MDKIYYNGLVIEFSAVNDNGTGCALFLDGRFVSYNKSKLVQPPDIWPGNNVAYVGARFCALQ